MTLHLVILSSDILLWLLLMLILGMAHWMRKQPQFTRPWRHVLSSPLAMISFVFLSFYFAIALIDSLHFQRAAAHPGEIRQVESVLDAWLAPLGQQDEKTYSAPFATRLYARIDYVNSQGKPVYDFAPLQYGGKPLHPGASLFDDVMLRLLIGVGWGALGLAGCAVLVFSLAYWRARRKQQPVWLLWIQLVRGQTQVAWRSLIVTLALLGLMNCVLYQLAQGYHVLGTDKVGEDIFYITLKSVRTGIIIGSVTTLFMLPFALLLGMMAGYFRGWIDDCVQFIYTVLSSVPGVLLISAAVLALQLFIHKHDNWFPSLESRSDIRLLALCAILGLTSWTTLCRLLRAETFKVREMEFVQAAHSMAVTPARILIRHIFPNILHLIIITIVLDFSGLVLAEAVLSYMGVGVDPSMASWGNMINSARLELAREPAVWWPLVAALVGMFGLVLAANIFADKVRDAFDPRVS